MSIEHDREMLGGTFSLPEFDNHATRSTDYVLYGAGELGRFTVKALREVGIEPLAFVDSAKEKWGTKVEGVEVFSLSDASRRWPKALYAVTIYTGATMRKRCRFEGLKTVSFAQLYRARLMRRTGVPLPYGSIDDADEIRKHREQIMAGLEVWADDLSRREYVAQVRYRLTLDDYCLPEASPLREMYHPPEMPVGASEVYVDCGAYDGDTVKDFLDRRPQKANSIVFAFEPDAGNCARMRARTDLRWGSGLGGLQIQEAAVGEKFGAVRFNDTGTPGSAVVTEGTENTVLCTTLDTVFAGDMPAPTRIKMDIEGSELAALRGGEKTIRGSKPNLAICLYHKGEDLWTIPMFLKEMLPGHDLFLRRYSDDCWELICYAVASRAH